MPDHPDASILAGLSDRVKLRTFDPEHTGDLDRVEFFVAPSMHAGLVRELLPRMAGLRIVQTLSAGVDWLGDDVPDHLTVCNAAGVHDAPVAEWILAAILAMQRRLPETIDLQRRATWGQGDIVPGELEGKRVLIVGHGAIGRAVERRLRAFDTEVTRVARTARPGIRSTDELPELLPDADVVVVLVPLTEETRGMFGAELLGAMAPGALLVNAARGPVVDTDALLAGLHSGAIRAALDVTDPEPLPEGHPLWSAPGCLISPHVGGLSPRFPASGYRLARRQLERYLIGEPLENVVGGAY